jgi:hypothetical protein
MPRYAKIAKGTMFDEKFLEMSNLQQKLFTMLLHHPAMTPMGAGVFSLAHLDAIIGYEDGKCWKHEQACEDAKCRAMPMIQWWADQNIVAYQRMNGHILIVFKNYLSYHLPDNPNTLISWLSCIEELPRSPCWAEVRDHLLTRGLQRKAPWLFAGLLDPLADNAIHDIGDRSLYWERLNGITQKPRGRVFATEPDVSVPLPPDVDQPPVTCAAVPMEEGLPALVAEEFPMTNDIVAPIASALMQEPAPEATAVHVLADTPDAPLTATIHVLPRKAQAPVAVRNTSPSPFASQLEADAAAVLAHLNRIHGTRYRESTYILRLLCTGVSVADCFLMIEWSYHINRMERPEQYKQYFSNKSPFIPENFDIWMQRARDWEDAGRPDYAVKVGVLKRMHTPREERRMADISAMQAGITRFKEQCDATEGLRDVRGAAVQVPAAVLAESTIGVGRNATRLFRGPDGTYA